MRKQTLILLISFILMAKSMNAQTENKFGLKIPDQVVDYWKSRQTGMRSFAQGSFPTSVDWSDDDSRVKNQSICGSCWAFAAVALIENLSCEQDLSEQEIISCASGGCSGGWYGDALKYVHDKGVPPDVCYPYQATDGNCDDACANPDYLVYVTNYDYYGRWGVPDASTVTDLKILLQQGPVCVSMYVPDDGTFEGYSGGVYDYEGGVIPSNRGHAVLVVGYDDAEQCFKAKNSWGSNWGENGYFRIAYDDVTDDVQFGGYACTASGIFSSSPTPVELSSFDFKIQKNSVLLTWSTISEMENYGFEVQRKIEQGDFEVVGFVKGFGTSSEPHFYEYRDNQLPVGIFHYRLRQIDFDGNYAFSPEIDVTVEAPKRFYLTQNYPNPFNQNTQFVLEVPDNAGKVEVSIFNILGQKVKTIKIGKLAAGYHSFNWDGKDESGNYLPSGIYYLQLIGENFKALRRMVLIR